MTCINDVELCAHVHMLGKNKCSSIRREFQNTWFQYMYACMHACIQTHAYIYVEPSPVMTLTTNHSIHTYTHTCKHMHAYKHMDVHIQGDAGPSPVMTFVAGGLAGESLAHASSCHIARARARPRVHATCSFTYLTRVYVMPCAHSIAASSLRA